MNTDDQSVCENQEIIPIIYQLGGGASGAVVTGLPNGLEYNYIQETNQIIIHGTSTVDVQSETIYNAIISTSGSSQNETVNFRVSIKPAGQDCESSNNVSNCLAFDSAKQEL